MAKSKIIKRIAKKLGAVVIVNELESDGSGKEYYEVDIISEGGCKTQRVCKISEEEAASGQYKLIGEAEGINFFHCLAIAGNHTKNFHERVAGFTVSRPTMKGTKVRVAFYEKA